MPRPTKRPRMHDREHVTHDQARVLAMEHLTADRKHNAIEECTLKLYDRFRLEVVDVWDITVSTAITLATVMAEYYYFKSQIMTREQFKGFDAYRNANGERFDQDGRRLYFFELIGGLGFAVSHTRPCADGEPIPDYTGDIDTNARLFAG